MYYGAPVAAGIGYCTFHRDAVPFRCPSAKHTHTNWQFHLKRFEYDPYRDDLAKIHDRFEFPTELDMSPWLKRPPNTPTGTDSAASVPSSSTTSADSDDADTADGFDSSEKHRRYRLSAIVMHVGGPAAGHYYAYVRVPKPLSSAALPPLESPGLGERDGKVPRGNGGAGRTRWIKLDDQRVTEVSEAEVLRDAFGGGGGGYRGPGEHGGGGLQALLGQVREWYDSRGRARNRTSYCTIEATGRGVEALASVG